VPEFSSRVVKEGGCCNFIFGYLCLMLIPRFVVVARAGKGDKSVLPATGSVVALAD